MSRKRLFALAAALVEASSVFLGAAVLAPDPLADIAQRARDSLPSISVRPTGLDRGTYLETASSIAGYFRHFQAPDGRILDPFQRKEVQYSTPCYAWAAAAVTASRPDPELQESAARALDSALRQLAEGKAADNHGDFFTFPAMLAFEHLRDRVPAGQRQRWEGWLNEMQPDRAYRDVLNDKRKTVHNWNVVALAGEFLRQQAGFTDASFTGRHWPAQLGYFTSMGLYQDPNVPMAYDHFPRHFLAVMLARGFHGAGASSMEELLQRGARASLLMQSPLGELPTGGRSAQHQWNEAEQCVTYEVWAKRSKAAGDPISAGAYKRAAHLALQSIRRWMRPSGELWIVKNRFDPAVRHGFETYSSHSQYNLLAASMLATAWLMADESIEESAAPADVGGFVFSVPEFHKIFANASGTYVEIDTAADAKYNSTGVLRVHRSGRAPALWTDNAPASVTPAALGPGWKANGEWQWLAGLAQDQIRSVALTPKAQTPERVAFDVKYNLSSADVTAVVEQFELTSSNVVVTVELEGQVSEAGIALPILAFDGDEIPQVEREGSALVVRYGGHVHRFTCETPGATLQRQEARVKSRNGYLDVYHAAVSGRRVSYRIDWPRSPKR